MPQNTAPTPAPSATASEAAEVELTDEDIPVAEDFVEEATKEIDEKNLSAKLDEIDKEIGSE